MTPNNGTQAGRWWFISNKLDISSCEEMHCFDAYSFLYFFYRIFYRSTFVWLEILTATYHTFLRLYYTQCSLSIAEIAKTRHCRTFCTTPGRRDEWHIQLWNSYLVFCTSPIDICYSFAAKRDIDSIWKISR